MRTRFRAKLFGGALAASAASILFSALLLLSIESAAADAASVRNMVIVALAVAVPVTLLVSWILAGSIANRVTTITRIAQRYATGDVSRPAFSYGGDEIGEVARALDDVVQQLGRRVEELSRDRARMEAILAGMVEGVLVVDRQGRLQLVNRAAQGMLRVDETAHGRPYLEVIRHPDIAEQITTALAGRDAQTRELALSRDPARLFVARASPVATGGGGGAVLVLHDITDLRRADQIRRDFVANVSHELRTPLTAIRGYVEALLEEPTQSDSARRFLEIVERHTARMDRLVTDLLRLARLDARQEVLEKAPCDLKKLVSAIVADLMPPIEAKRQRVSIQIAAEACELSADAAKLHDIIRNLLENASKYSPENAVIEVAASRGANGFLLTVSDSGPGIPPEDLTRVFERFYQVDKSRASGGTGLGLAIVKHLVELHGGRVTAANAPKGGAVFTVALPV